MQHTIIRQRDGTLPVHRKTAKYRGWGYFNVPKSEVPKMFQVFHERAPSLGRGGGG